MPELSDFELFNALLCYCPETGSLTWKIPRGRHAAGSVAGNLDSGYRRVGVLGRSYKAHRIAHLLMTGAWPTEVMDHINRNGHDNRWVNLRSASRSGNCCNKAARADTKSGVKGLHYDTRGRRWIAQIGVKGAKRLQKGFSGRLEAEAWLLEKQAELHGEFAGSQGVRYSSL